MIRLRFERAAGTTDATAEVGERLLDVAQAAGQPLEGTCNGCLACATCHVVLAPEDWDKVPPPGPEEEDMLDLARGATRWSRLSCQVRVAAALDGAVIRVPPQ
jgi:ferredoxin-2, mitochondrial